MLNPLSLVIILLLFSTLACYSDSPLWFGGDLTPTPLVATPLPTPQPGQAQLEIGSSALVVVRLDQPGFRLTLTNYPEKLKADLTNRAPQSCSTNAPVKILYHAFEEESGTIYYLVDCDGGVGWAEESNFLGPIPLVTGDRALTTQAGVQNGFYKIEAGNPPYDPNNLARQRFDCRVNDIVDVLEISGFSTGELYYKIRCTNPLNPVTPNVGWTTPETLFGPVRFRSGETGLVPNELDQIELTETFDSANVTATCERGEIVTITDQPVQRLEDELFYEMTCAAGSGWANQQVLVGPIRYPVGTQVIVTVPLAVVELVTAAATPIATDVVTELQDTGEELDPASTSEPAPENVPSVILMAAPGAAEQVGTCPDAALTAVEALAGVNGIVYAQVTCGEATGWLDSSDLYGAAQYAIGETVQLGEKALLGFNQRGVYLSLEIFDIQGASGGSSVIAGECAFNFETNAPIDATITDVGYYRTSLGAIVGIFYKATCLDAAGNTIEGWLNQSRIGE